jgi:hypothetical protein
MAEIPDLIDLVASLGVDVYAFGRYCPTSGQRVEEFHMEPLEYRALLVECQDRKPLPCCYPTSWASMT